MLKFECLCGKRLSAPERLAGTTAACPRCGAPVAVPAGKASPAAPPAPDSEPTRPALSWTAPRAGQKIFVKVPRSGIDRTCTQALIRRRTGNYHDPMAGLQFLLPVSGGLALLTAFGLELYPHVLHGHSSDPTARLLMTVWMLATGLTLGYGCNYLDSVLAYALAGKGHIYLPERSPRPAVRSLVRWGLCLACGPVLFFFAALEYWVHCGDVRLLDGLILAELTAAGFGCWVLALVVTAPLGETAEPPSRHPLDILRRFDRRRMLTGVALLAVALAHAGLGIVALLQLRGTWLWGLFLLWICWFSAGCCATSLLKNVGWRLDRAPKAAPLGGWWATP